MDSDLFERVWHPKAIGAWRLHQAIAGHDLDWWVNFSSAASLRGSPGQTAYAMANAWLDSFTSWRAQRGMRTITVQWGAWAEHGQAAHRAAN